MGCQARRLLAAPSATLGGKDGRRLFPRILAIAPEANIEPVRVAELEHLDALRSRYVGVGNVGSNEESVAGAQSLAADLQAAADDVVQTIAAVRVDRQRIAAFEPNVGQAESRCGIEQLDHLP